MKANDLTGRRFERLLVVSRAPNRGGRVYWFCQCDCGRTSTVVGDTLRSGLTRSCGCLRRETTSARSRTHGHTTGARGCRSAHTKEYRAWSHAKGRCNNPGNKKYSSYGLRGITMCQHWQEDFANFYADMGPCPTGMTLERIDVNGDYEPGNCKWATDDEQANNKRQSVIVKWLGETLSLRQVSRAAGVNYKSLHAAYRYRGITIEEAVASLTARISTRPSM